MGLRTSVWLPDDLAARYRQARSAGLRLPEIVRRGLDASREAPQAPMDPGIAQALGALRAELAGEIRELRLLVASSTRDSVGSGQRADRTAGYPAAGQEPADQAGAGLPIPLEPGSMVTIQWSGQLRTVAVARDQHGGLVLRDLTPAELDEMDEMAAMQDREQDRP
jgi:hypothetical protein